jgi:ABC-type bacteriocin/lantibiotic exporter with double-glycine peptidase domain
MNHPKLLDVKPLQEKLHAGYCGPAVLKMILSYYSIEKTEDELAELAGTTKGLGTDDNSLKRVLESFNLKVVIKNDSNFKDIQHWLNKDVPVIVELV